MPKSYGHYFAAIIASTHASGNPQSNVGMLRAMQHSIPSRRIPAALGGAVSAKARGTRNAPALIAGRRAT